MEDAQGMAQSQRRSTRPRKQVDYNEAGIRKREAAHGFEDERSETQVELGEAENEVQAGAGGWKPAEGGLEARDKHKGIDIDFHHAALLYESKELVFSVHSASRLSLRQKTLRVSP